MPLPNFFVIGAPKAGTTALYLALRQHPDIYMSRLKEPHYFSGSPIRLAPQEPSRRVIEPVEYLALFSAASGEHVIGEASPSYLRSSLAARRIRHNLPDAKLVAILRHPVERAHSSYWFHVMLGHERAPTFEAALAPERPPERDWAPPHYAPGLYHAHLSRYFELFPRQQIRVYLYEDWRDTPQATLRDLFAFLGVDPGFSPAIRDINTTFVARSQRLHRYAGDARLPGLARVARRLNRVTPPPIPVDTWCALLARYREDIEQLQSLIGRDLSHWLEPQAVEDSHALA